MSARRVWAMLGALAACAGCDAVIDGAGGGPGDGPARILDGGAPGGHDLRPTPPPPDLAPALPDDDAVITHAELPPALGCNETFAARVTVRNRGAATWTPAAGYKLGAVGDSDPLHPVDGRIYLPEGAAILPGGEHAFDIAMTAPAKAGNYLTRWQMVREGVHWFGAVASQTVTVTCAQPPPFDFAQAVVLNSPADVAKWPATAKLTVLDLAPDGVFVDFTKKVGMGSWPDVPFGKPGDSLQYTLWIVLSINGKWYASGCIEYWRGLDRNGGPPNQYAMNWYYDPNRWGPMVGHQPAVGEKVGFLVTAGDARNNGNAIVKERSDVVFVAFPTAAGGVFKF